MAAREIQFGEFSRGVYHFSINGIVTTRQGESSRVADYINY